MTARMYEPGRRTRGVYSRMRGKVATAAFVACALIASPAAGKNPHAEQVAPAAAPVTVPPGQAKKAAGALPPGQAKKAAPAASRAASQPAAKSHVKAVTPNAAAHRSARANAVAQHTARAVARPLAAQTASVPTATAAAANPGQARKAAKRAAQRKRVARARAARARAASTRAATVRRTAARRSAVRRRARAAAATTATAVVTPTAFTPIAATTTTSAPATTPARSAPRRAAPKKRAAPTRPPRDRSPVTVVSHTVTNTVRDIAHVIPGWAKALIAALACLLALAAALILFGAIRARRLRAQRAALAADVGVLQGALLPDVPAAVGALAVSVAYRPAEGLAAGGDFYDVFPLDNGRVGIIVGDVSGHGRDSLRSATFTRHMVRSYLEAGLAPRSALQLAGRVVDEHDREEFATVLAAIHDPNAGTLSYASAGHPPPVVQGPVEHQPLIVASAPPIGVDEPTGLRQTTIPFPPGSSMCLFTDGLFEGRYGVGMYGRRRLEDVVKELGPEATASELINRVVQDSDGIRDDIAVCMIRVDGGSAGASTVRVEEIEVGASELKSARLQRFLTASGVEPEAIDEVVKTARRRGAGGRVVLRVRQADDRSGVDVLPVVPESEGSPVALLRPAQAG